MMKTSLRSIIFIVVCTIFTFIGQILMKLGVDSVSRSVLEVINWYLFFGLFSYGVGFILMFLAFKEGELSVLYPILSTSYVWVVLLSPFIFVGESIGALKLIGVTIIIFSVSLIGIGASKNRGGIVG